jgi:hypothetical protein
MLKFTSASGSDFRAITATDIPHIVTIIRTGIITDRTIGALTIAPIIGQVGVGITATIIPITITAGNFRVRSKQAGSKLFLNRLDLLPQRWEQRPGLEATPVYFSDFGEVAGFAAGFLTG